MESVLSQSSVSTLHSTETGLAREPQSPADWTPSGQAVSNIGGEGVQSHIFISCNGQNMSRSEIFKD